MRRRDFIKLTSTGLLAASTPFHSYAFNFLEEKKYLFLIELAGGNDGLNTIVPLDQYDTYKKIRKSIHLKDNQLNNTFLQDNLEFAFNPNLNSLFKLYNEGDLIPLLGIGVKDSKGTKSHFKGINIWNRGSSNLNNDGWLTQVNNELSELKYKKASSLILRPFRGTPLDGSDGSSIEIKNIEHFQEHQRYIRSLPSNYNNPKIAETIEFIKNLDIDLSKLPTAVNNIDFPDHVFGEDIKTALILLSQPNTHIPVIKLRLPGFDTHVNQMERHEKLMNTLNQGISSLVQSLKEMNIYNDSLIFTYSEFGRRPYENMSIGTDHGTSNVQFLIGGGLNGARAFGSYPSLDFSDKDQNLEVKLDFRKVYASIIQDFFKIKLSEKSSFEDRLFLSSQYYDKNLNLF